MSVEKLGSRTAQAFRMAAEANKSDEIAIVSVITLTVAFLIPPFLNVLPLNVFV